MLSQSELHVTLQERLLSASVSWFDNVMINHEMSLKVTMFFLNIFGDLTS